MYGYAAASASAAQLTPYPPPPNTATPEGVAGQGVAVAQAAAEPAGNSGQTAAAVTQLIPAAAVPQTLQQLSTGVSTTWPFSLIENQIKDFLTYGLPTPTNNWLGLASSQYTPILKNTLQAYFGVGLGQFAVSIGQQLTFGTGTTAGAGGAWYPTPQFAGLHLGAVGGGGLGGAHTASAVSAGAGQAGKVGLLSVPANWTTPTSEATVTLAAAEETPIQAGAGTSPGAPANAVLRGFPPGAAGRRTAGYGYTNKYGFRYSVLTRPPSAG